MGKKFNKAILIFIVITIVQFAATLVFLKLYRGIYTFTLISEVILFNALFLAINTLLAYRTIMKYYKETLNLSNLGSILYELMQKSTEHASTDALYTDILEAAVKAVPAASKGCIMLLDNDSDILRFVAVSGYDKNILKQTHLKLEESFLYRETKGLITHSVVIDNPFDYDLQIKDSKTMDVILSAGTDAVMTSVSTPILYDGKLYGMINLDSAKRHVYTDNDVNTIELFAHEIVNVIRLYHSYEENTYLSTHDLLTGIYNRSYFNQKLSIFNSGSHCNTITIISMDLNNLKKTNDTYGHLVGDELLKRFVEGFTHTIGTQSCFARYGGDEFALLLPDYNTTATNALLDYVKDWHKEHPLSHEGILIPIEFSYGIVCSPKEGTNLEELMHKADQRMYEHKRLSKENI